MDVSRATAKIFGAKASNAVLSFAAIAYFSRTIGSSALGSYFLFEALIGIFGLFADIGINYASEKRISEGFKTEKVLSSAIMAKFGLLVILSFPILLFSDQLKSYIGYEVVIALLLGICLRQSANLVLRVLNGELRVEETAVLRFIRRLVWAVVSIGLVFFDYSFTAPVIGLLTAELLVTVLGIYKIRPEIVLPDRDVLYSLISFGKYSFVGSVGGHAYNWADIAILGLFVSQTQVAGYEIAWRISEIIILFAQSIRTVIFPQMSSWVKEDKIDKVENLVKVASFVTLLISIPSFFGVIILGSDIIANLFDEKYVFATIPLIILVAEKSSRSLQLLYIPSLMAFNRPEMFAKAMTISISINVFLNFTLVPQFGIIGGAIATTIASGSAVVAYAIYLRNFLDIWPPIMPVAWTLVSAVAMFVVLRIIEGYFTLGSGLRPLSTILIVGVVVYFVIVLMSKEVRRLLRTTAELSQR